MVHFAGRPRLVKTARCQGNFIHAPLQFPKPDEAIATQVKPVSHSEFEPAVTELKVALHEHTQRLRKLDASKLARTVSQLKNIRECIESLLFAAALLNQIRLRILPGR